LPSPPSREDFGSSITRFLWFDLFIVLNQKKL
jgi:hypothetical protein